MTSMALRGFLGLRARSASHGPSNMTCMVTRCMLSPATALPSPLGSLLRVLLSLSPGPPLFLPCEDECHELGDLGSLPPVHPFQPWCPAQRPASQGLTSPLGRSVRPRLDPAFPPSCCLLCLPREDGRKARPAGQPAPARLSHRGTGPSRLRSNLPPATGSRPPGRRDFTSSPATTASKQVCAPRPLPSVRLSHQKRGLLHLCPAQVTRPQGGPWPQAVCYEGGSHFACLRPVLSGDKGQLQEKLITSSCPMAGCVLVQTEEGQSTGHTKKRRGQNSLGRHRPGRNQEAV